MLPRRRVALKLFPINLVLIRVHFVSLFIPVLNFAFHLVPIVLNLLPDQSLSIMIHHIDIKFFFSVLILKPQVWIRTRIRTRCGWFLQRHLWFLKPVSIRHVVCNCIPAAKMKQQMRFIRTKVKWLKFWLPARVDLAWMRFSICTADQHYKETDPD